MHFFNFVKISGSCEIIGTFCGLFLILYTERKWMWTGIFNILAGFIAYTAWLIPLDSKLLCFKLKKLLIAKI